MKITVIDKQSIELIKETALVAMNSVLRDMGLKAVLLPGRISPIKYTASIEIVVDDPALAIEEERQKFALFAPQFGLKPEWFGKTIRLQNSFYKIVGIRPNAHKNVVFVESAKGKRYVVAASSVRVED